MRRLALPIAVLLAATAAAASASAAPRKPLPRVGVLMDATGDWQVAGEDIVHGTVSGAKGRLTVDLAFAGPIPTTPSYYQVQFKVGCNLVTMAVNTANGKVLQDGSVAGAQVYNNFYSEYTCTPDNAGQYGSVDSTNDAPKVVGQHLRWNVRYLKGMKPGSVISDLSASSNRAGIDPVVYVGPTRSNPTVGDRASSTQPFTLG